MPEATITCAELTAAPWKEALETSSEQSFIAYSSALSKKINDLPEDSKYIAVLRLLSDICSMYFESDDESPEAYAPGLTFLPQNISAEQADELFSFLPHIEQPDLKARIADIIWISRKGNNKFPAAQIAIDNLLAAGNEIIKSDDAFRGIERLQRAANLASELGRGGQEKRKEVAESCWNNLKLLANSEVDACQHRLIKLILKLDDKDLYALGGVSWDLSEKIEATRGNWDLIRSYWGLTSEIFRHADRHQTAKSAANRAAWTYVTQTAQVDSFTLKATFLSSGIEAYRRLGKKEKADLLHKWLIRVQKSVHKEMTSISSGPVDLSEVASEAIKRVEEKPIREAIIAFCLATQPSSPQKLKEQAIKNSQKFALSSIFGGVHVNTEGKVVAKTPPSGRSDSKENEKSIQHNMHFYFNMDCRVNVVGVIEPARHQLSLEHRLVAEEIYPLVANNPFVPEGREAIFARGLAAGFAGDFLIALNLLIPQIENSLRVLIKNYGGITSTITPEGIQKERMLPDLLDDEIIVKILGERTIFCLKTILIEQTGSNLRHSHCHGLLHHDQYFSHSAVYLWWLTLRICCIPIIHEWLNKKETEKKTPSPETTEEQQD